MSHYFRSGLCLDFLKYFSIFESSSHFSEHVGKPCSTRWTKRMKSRFVRLVKARQEAKERMDFELLTEIETGEFKLN